MSLLKSNLSKVSAFFGFIKHYQQRRRIGTQERWRLIQPKIGGARSLLDVGCAGGLLTTTAAEAGLFSIGLEKDFDRVRWARKQPKPDQSVAFMHSRVTPDSVQALPVCDIVLCLSVYHVWHREFGHEAAQQMLRSLGTKATRGLFFEPASRQKKYGSTPPVFSDGDKDSILDYNTRMLSGLFGGSHRVEYLGESACIGKEPYRYLFMIRTGNAD